DKTIETRSIERPVLGGRMEKRSHKHTQVLPIEPAEPQGRSGSSVAGSHFQVAEVAEERRDPQNRVSRTSQPTSRRNIPGEDGNRAENIASSIQQWGTGKGDSHGDSVNQAPTVPTEEQSHPLLEAIVSNTTDAMVAINHNFEVLDFNPAANSMLGWTAENALGYHCS